MSRYLNLINLTFNKTKEYYYDKNYKREKIYIVGNGWSSYYLTKFSRPLSSSNLYKSSHPPI